MKHVVNQKMTPMLLAAIMCILLCVDIPAYAQDTGAQLTQPPKQETDIQDMQEDNETDRQNLVDEEEPNLPETDIQQGTDATDVPLPPEEESIEADSAEQPSQETKTPQMLSSEVSKLAKPTWFNDPSLAAKRRVTWYCVEFGSYPQAEVIPSIDEYEKGNKAIMTQKDVIIDRSLYNTLKSSAQWDADGELTINGDKYRRIQRSDATYSDSGLNGRYDWRSARTYHYFKYQPVKWRVLRLDGSNTALLLSDLVLDTQRFHTENNVVSWSESSMRSWLNGISKGVYKQKCFFDSAFSAGEKTAIADTELKYPGNTAGTDGAEATKDKIFFLSDAEVCGEEAYAYGFTQDMTVYDEARRCRSSAYAKAMGLASNGTGTIGTTQNRDEALIGNCGWWLRSTMDGRPSGKYFRVVDDDGSAGNQNGAYNHDVYLYELIGMRPALTLDLSSSAWEYTGTVDSGEMNRALTMLIGSTGSGTGTDTDTGTPIISSKVKISSIRISGISKKIAAGKKIALSANITPSDASNKNITWKSSNTKLATVNSSGVVTLNKKSGGKSVTITATAADGSNISGSYKITSMKGMVKKVSVSGKKTVKAGSTLKLKAKVKASKKANTKVKWTTSNKNYATVSSSGKVKALKAGKGRKVKITAAATDGSKKKKTITINIK